MGALLTNRHFDGMRGLGQQTYVDVRAGGLEMSHY